MIRILPMSCLLIAFLTVGSEIRAQTSDAVVPVKSPLLNAHAHNDYEHERPLMDALDLGFTSIEADVFLVEGQLLVAHNFWDVSRERTLEKLYLRPLQELAVANGGRVYKDGPAITLLVDIKKDGAAAYAALDELLAKYDSLISITQEGKHVEKAVTVIISGDRPIQEIERSQPRRAGIDGRLADLDSDKPASLLPLISDNWSNHFKFRGKGEMPLAEREKLHDIVARAHARGRRVRFWATPESPEVWRELKNAGVDLIGTDDLSGLSTFLRQ